MRVAKKQRRLQKIFMRRLHITCCDVEFRNPSEGDSRKNGLARTAPPETIPALGVIPPLCWNGVFYHEDATLCSGLSGYVEQPDGLFELRP